MSNNVSDKIRIENIRNAVFNHLINHCFDVCSKYDQFKDYIIDLCKDDKLRRIIWDNIVSSNIGHQLTVSINELAKASSVLLDKEKENIT